MKLFSKKKKVFFIVIIAFLSVYLGWFFTNLIHPKVQLFIDTANVDETNKIVIGNYQSGLEEVEINDNKASYHTSIRGNDYDVLVSISDDKIDEVSINGKKVDNLEKISDYTNSRYYSNTYCVKLNVSSYKHYILLALLIIVFALFLYFIGLELFVKGKYKSKLIYSNSSLKVIGKKPIIISFIVTLLTMVLHAGCDLSVISETIIMHMKGIDIYQLFATMNEYKGVTLMMWQYDGAMLSGYSLPSYLTYPFLHFFNPLGYHWIQALIYKLFNILLCNLFVLTLISYLLDKKIIKEKKAKILYYISIFNPVTFYVAIWFIQFDILPAYLFLLGILLMDNLKENWLLSSFCCALAVSCKMTMWMFLPAFGVLMLFIFLKNKNYVLSIKHFVSFVFFTGLMLLSTRLFSSPVSLALSNVAQSERIWYTIFPYLAGLSLFVAIFVIVVSFILNYCDINLKLSVDKMILITILSCGVTTMAFSFSTVSTPSFWIQSLGAFMILYALTDDSLSLFMLVCFSVLMICQYACLPEGDVTASLHFLGKQSIFDKIRERMIENGKFERWQSLLFTISQAVMFVFMIIFSKVIKRVKKES